MRAETKEYILPWVEGIREKFYFDFKFKCLKEQKIVLISDSSTIINEVKAVWRNFSLKKVGYFHPNDFKIETTLTEIIVVIHINSVNRFLMRLNSYYLEGKLKFVKGMFTGHKFLLTPFLLPRQGPCYNCYLMLKYYNSIYDQDTLPEKSPIKIRSYPKIWLQFSVLFLTLKLTEWLAKEIYTREEIAEYILDLKEIDITNSPLLRVPNCPSCRKNAE